MADKKTNIRSIRFSDEMAELINQQSGESFTAKFENLITRCVWEAPAAERKIKAMEEDIRRKQRQLRQMEEIHIALQNSLVDIELKMDALNRAITKALKDFDAV